MPLPEWIKILDARYDVEYLDDVVEKNEDTIVLGEVSYWRHQMRIYAGTRNQTVIRHSIWHEIFHALAEKLHITVDGVELRDDEAAIDLLASGICIILDDNPELSTLGD